MASRPARNTKTSTRAAQVAELARARARTSDAARAEILAAFDRQASSPELTRNPDMLDAFMHQVAGTVVDRFLVPARWEPSLMRRVLELVIEIAPDVDLADMVKSARYESAWVEHFEKSAAWERETGTLYPHPFTYPPKTAPSSKAVRGRGR